MNWKNEQGVSLVEVLIVILLMTVILTPITLLVTHSLKTEKDVSVRNELQREARLIMEQISVKMRDSGNYWLEHEGEWALCEHDKVNDSCSSTYLTYSPVENVMYLGNRSGRVLANHVILTLDPEPNATGILLNSLDKQKVHLEIAKDKHSIELETTIYFDRY